MSVIKLKQCVLRFCLSDNNMVIEIIIRAVRRSNWNGLKGYVSVVMPLSFCCLTTGIQKYLHGNNFVLVKLNSNKVNVRTENI